MKNEKTFSERLKSLRKTNALSQEQASEGIGITRIGYQNYEAGRRKPTYDILITLSDFYHVSIDYLVGRTDNPEVNR